MVLLGGPAPDNDTPRGKQVKHLIEPIVLMIAKIKATITIGTSSEAPILKTSYMQERIDRITGKIREVIESIAKLTEPDSGFAKDCDKLSPASSKMTPIDVQLMLPDGLSLHIGLEIETDGYTPRQSELAGLVAEAMEPVLAEVEQIWIEDGANVDEVAAWHIDAERRIAHSFGFPMHHSELVGATAGGSGSEGGGIEHRADAGLDG